ncbi:MAG: heavy metal translocating P-type ATPase [Olsenella sp.]|nr:heavy metal translocating P-type ATPase [Olsenella sp.]
MEEEENRTKLARIVASAVLLVVAVVVQRTVELPMWGHLLAYLVPYLVAGYDVLAEAWEGVREGDPFDEDFLMAIATIGALAIGFLPGSDPEFAEAVFVMLFFQVGELFEDIAEDRSERSISHLMDIRPDVATVVRDGAEKVVSPADVRVGETIVVRPGERVPLDGVVLEGETSLDTMALTGESMPRPAGVGDELLSGCVNVSGVVRARVTKSFGESTASKVLDLVENASESKSRSEAFITRFARVYTPVVVFAAVATALVPPLVSGDFAASFPTWLARALTFLVVSCPCALVISVPLTFFGGLGGASRRGILVKGSNYLEALAKAGVVVFDKTGTLTKGEFKVVSVVSAAQAGEKDVAPATAAPAGASDELLHFAAHVESFSNHPIATALREAFSCLDDGCEVADVHEVAGKGVVGTVNGHVVAVGNELLMQERGVACVSAHERGTIVHVASDDVYLGYVVIADEPKPDARKAVADIKAEGVRRTVMLTGDHAPVAESVASELGIDEVHAELLPQDKVSEVERLISEKGEGETLAFVGDGINDAPVLARADIGIAMGALGSDAAIDAADVVLMDDEPSKIAVAIRVARRTLRIARQNTVFAIAVKVAVLVLAFFGLASMWLAVFADVGVMVLAVLNATRALR